MAAITQIALMAAMVTASLVAMWGNSTRPGAKRVALGVGAGLTYGLLTATLGLHLCGAGVPVRPMLLGIALVGLVVTTVEPAARRWGTAGAVSVLGLVAVLHFVAAVHGPTVTGNPEWVERTEQRQAAARWHSPFTGLYDVAPPATDEPSP